MKIAAFFTLFLFVSLKPALAQQIPASKAVIAILGEAEDQGYRGMLAVACGIRNRGSLQGVYGVNAPRPNTPGVIQPQYWEMAERAWLESEKNRIHFGTHWENVKKFGKPFWVKGMKKICTIGDHIFYTVKTSKPRKG